MVHESVLDVIDDDYDDDSDYEGGYEEDEEAGQLQSGFKAMDITSRAQELGNVGGEASLGEDGEIAVVDGGQNGTDRDSRRAGVQEGKDGRGKNQRKKKKKSKKGDRRKQSNRAEQSLSIERFVVVTCRRLEETKYPLFREAVDRIGIEGMKVLLNQVDVIEKCGGQTTADGLRRRTVGGVLWNLLRDHVGPVLYKEIMKEGNRKYVEKQKERQNEREQEREKERGSGKRQHMEVDTEGDERQNVKRRRTSMDVDGPRARGLSQKRQSRVSLREEVDHGRAPAALQNAWIQGLKKQSEREVSTRDSTINPNPSEGKGPAGMKRPVSERIRMTVSYGDIVEERQIATDSPIHGVTEIDDLGIEEEQRARGQMNEDPDDDREEGEIAD